MTTSTFPLNWVTKRNLLTTAFVCAAILILPSIGNAQCEILRGPGGTVSEDFDNNQGPYTDSLTIYDAALDPAVSLNADLTINICFWGDMDSTAESFDVIIAGITFSSGEFGFSPTAGAPVCVDYVIPAASAKTDLSDGDIDVTYNNFGAGWTSAAGTTFPDDFNAQITRAELDIDIAVAVTNPFNAIVCQNVAAANVTATPADGTSSGVGTFSITPASAAFTEATGNFDPSQADPGVYDVTYDFEFEGCSYTNITTFEVVAVPIATLKDTIAACGSSGYDLTELFTDATVSGGTFTTVTTGASIDGNILTYDSTGCVDITYTLTDPGSCTGAITQGTATLFFPEDVSPNFLITSSTSCWDGTAPLALEVNVSSPTYSTTPTAMWTETSSGVTVNIGDPTSQTEPMITLTQDGASTFGSVRLCLTESITSSDVCATDATCTDFRCREFTITVAGCNVDCSPFGDPPDMCPLLTNSSFAFELLGQTFAFGDADRPLFEASVVPGEYITPNDFSAGGTGTNMLSCTDDGLEVSWDFGLNDDLFPSNVFDVPIADIVPAVGGYCDAATFGFNFPSGFCGNCGPLSSPNLCINVLSIRPCIKVDRVEPLSFLNFNIGGLGPICDITGRELIVDPLQTIIQETAIAVVWADTDGDGAFDYVLEQGGIIFDGSAAGMGFVPNNVQGEGTITVRNLAASIIPPYSPCVAPEGQSLIELLPIDFIPVVGPIINQALTSIGLDFNIAPSANFDLPIRVTNDQEPVFLNFPSQYVFSQAGGCSTPINFSTPIAVDACTGDIIQDVVQVSGPASGDILSIPNPNPVDPNNPNLYQVSYRATACNGDTMVRTFDILITSDDPQLQCPTDLTIKNDADACSKIVTGISPLQGFGCDNTITWTAPGATPSAGNDDASGTEFPVGTTEVTYTLTYTDQNGATQTQTCSFDVTVLDAQAPIAACRDFEIQLDATGQAIVNVADIEGGSSDNCTAAGDLLIDLARTDMVFGPSVTFDCSDEGQQTVILRVTDEAMNERRCLGLVTITDFFSDYELSLDVPELCIEANNPEQLNFSNYLIITDGEGNMTTPLDEMNDGDMIGGMFSITSFNSSVPDNNITLGTSVDDPGDAGYINPITGEYTPGTGTGFVTVSYIIVIDGQVTNSTTGIDGCFKYVTDVFELRQPLAMDEPECECLVQNDRVVNLGEITGGLEPYTIQYGGVKLDFDNDGIADEQDGEFTFEGTVIGSMGVDTTFDITDFTQDLGNLLVDYTQPTWFFTVVDARGCELFRSGSCDNADELGSPVINCQSLGPVNLFTEDLLCESQYTWEHPLPADNCDVILYTYTITNPDGSVAGPFDLTALLNPDITTPPADQFSGEYAFQHISPTLITSTVTYYAEDAVGNFSTCEFVVNVRDDDAPFFLNCIEPAVIVDAIEGQCVAFANYALPIAGDNCSVPEVIQVDNTGLVTGDLYPVGITINTFEAVDSSGNKLRCDVKVIVNDIFLPPSFECPDDVTQTADSGDCGAVVTDIAPTNIEDNCIDNVTTIYKITDEDGNELASGFDDASGYFFELGTSTVSYATQDQPLLLITEITHDLGNTVDGTDPFPGYTAGIPTTEDYLEITNFNSAVMDVSCLMIERYSASGLDTVSVPTFNLLEPGESVVIHFGSGTNSLADHFVNVPGAADLAPNEPAAYVISLSRQVLDVAVINGFDLTGLDAASHWSGSINVATGAGIIRTTVWDSNAADDFVAGEACNPTTIGSLNPQLAQPTPNGTQTAIQAQPIVRVECAPFTVTITDDEPATCGLYSDYTDYEAGPIDIDFGECAQGTVINITDTYTIADLNFTLTGTVGDLSNLTVSLISPEGTQVDFIEASCAGSSSVDVVFDGDAVDSIATNCGSIGSGGTFVPVGNIEAFNGETVTGNWTVQIGNNGTASQTTATISSALISISGREDYVQTNVDLENDLGVCGAEFTYDQAVLFDNCPGGTVTEEITFEDGTVLLTDMIGILDSNNQRTFFFPVGTSTVRFILTDAAGNMEVCDFEVLVRDTEDPVLTCPADVTIQLESGECDVVYIPTDFTAEDNCAVTEIFSVPDFNDPLPIGVNDVDFTIRDAAGNDTTCTYTVTVLENIPMPPVMACIAQIGIHLDEDCEQEIIPEMVLAGDDFFCFDEYEIILFEELEDGTRVQLPDNVVGIGQIGDNIIYEISEARSGPPCWGYIEVGFFNAPEFICPSDTTVSCNALTDTASLGSPTLLSCALAGATVSFADTLERFERCDDPRAILRRTWTVEDNFGNAGSCVQTITIEAFDLSLVRFPANFDDVEMPSINCVAAANDPSLTDPANTGFPFVEDGNNIFMNGFCSASYLYDDEVYNICAGSYEIVRTWKVRNTCAPVVPGVNPIEAIQIIRVLDQANPVITCPADETISTGPFDCNGSYVIPEPEIQASCAGVTYTVSTSGGTLVEMPDGRRVLTELEQGTYSIRYEVEDECGRYNECIYFLTVTDQVDAQAICENGLNVSLDGNGTAILTAEDIDGGSDDLCSTVELAIRRELTLDPLTCAPLSSPSFTPWGDAVDVNCCDVDALVKVELRVTDEDGNESSCWTEVLIEDKLAPVCAAPQPLQITCEDLDGDFPANLTEAFEQDTATTVALLNDLFGEAQGIDNCGEATVRQTVVDSRTNCGTGSIFRRFFVEDARGLAAELPCTQTIQVGAVHDYTIEFPGDRESNDCVEPGFDEPTFTDFGCGLITTSTVIDTFLATADECYKLRLTYELINWCEYLTEADPYVIPRDADNDNVLEESTFLHVYDVAGVDIALLDRDANRANSTTIAFLDFQDEGTPGFSTNLLGTQEGSSALAGYNGDPSRGYFVYQQYIKVYDDTAPTLDVSSSETTFCDEDGDCQDTATLSFSVSDLCSPTAVNVSVSLDAFIDAGTDDVYTLADFVGDGGDASAATVPVDTQEDLTEYTTTLNDLPIGTHAIRVIANDGCGNTAVDLIVFDINDCKAPTPICINGLTVTAMPDGQGGGMAEIWAVDFIASAATDCSGEVKYAIYRSSDASADGFVPNIDDIGLTLDCDDAGMLAVRVYAIDPTGLADYCETTIFVQSNNICDVGNAALIAGTIIRPNNSPMSDVVVNLSNTSGMASQTQTDENGLYVFPNLTIGEDYSVQADYDPAVDLQRISTGDLILISRHILGLSPLQEIHQERAADVNQDNLINVIDIIAIRRVILGLTEGFDATPSWRFYTAQGAEVINQNNLSGPVTGLSFIATEMGNVTDATANGYAAAAEGRQSFELSTEDIELNAGQTATVSLTLPAALRGFQGTLELATGIELTDITYAAGADAAANLDQVANGLVAISYLRTLEQDEKAVDVTLNIRSEVAGRLSDLLRLSDRITATEAYDRTLTMTDLQLGFAPITKPTWTFQLQQNAPNPFAAATTIGFVLPESGPATLKFQDLQGRLIATRKIDGQQGENFVTISREELKYVSGVITYTLVAGQHVATRKMILQ
ncbi:MAG: HYR domain-containing protein [Bacteroidota bacterium]